MTHPDNQILFQLLDGELLDEARAAEVRLHLTSCAHCAATARSVQAMGDGLRVWAEDLPQDDLDLADAIMAGIEASVIGDPVVLPGAGTQDVAPPVHATGRVVSLRRWIWPTLAAAAAALLAVGMLHTPRVKPPGVPVVPVVGQQATAPPVGASVARVEVAGAQSYAVLVIPGIQDGATTSVVWIQDDPEDPTPDGTPTVVQ